MEANIYAPPQAALTPPVERDEINTLYVVSMKKFWILSLGTFGTYSLYWFYKNWAIIRDKDNEHIYPIARAIFSVFFIHSLFSRIDARLAAAGKSYSWSSQTIATLLVIVTIVSSIAGRIDSRQVSDGIMGFVTIILILLSAYLESRAQCAINVAASDERGASNENFTGANYFWLALGAAFWALFLIGSYAILNEGG